MIDETEFLFLYMFLYCDGCSECGLRVLQMLGWLYLPLSYILEKLEAILPSNLLHQLSRI